MLQQAFDFKNESDCLYKILDGLPESDLERKTQFKEWSFNTIIRHLHVWNYAANIALSNSVEWEKFSDDLKDNFNNGKSLNDFENNFSDQLRGKKLLEKWKSLYLLLADKFKSEIDSTHKLNSTKENLDHDYNMWLKTLNYRIQDSIKINSN